MLPASNRGAGMNIGFPDVCMTPAVPSPIPTPYPNLAMNAQATPFSETVMVSMMNALNQSSQIPMTSGDEGGSASPIKGPGRYTMGNPIVYVDMMPAINLTCPTTGNNMNNPLGAVLVPSATNVFYNHRGSCPEGALTAEAVERLGAALSVRQPIARIPTRDGAVACLSVAIFTRDLPTLLHNEVAPLVARGMTALVLDLRGCPGGDLDACLRLAGDFLDRDSAIATMIELDGDETPIRARQGDPYRFPLAILVDRGTASAAELFAGSLQAHGRALVVGERTYGKGSAQQVLPGFDEPGARYATVATFTLPRRDGGHPHTPGGEPIEGRGIHPDVEVPPEHALDAALDALVDSPSHRNEVP